MRGEVIKTTNTGEATTKRPSRTRPKRQSCPISLQLNSGLKCSLAFGRIQCVLSTAMLQRLVSWRLTELMCLAMSNKKRHALEECRIGTKVYLRPGLSLETDLGDGGSDSPGERSLA